METNNGLQVVLTKKMGRHKTKEKKPMYTCEVCHCPPIANHPEHIARHKNGERHKRLSELVLKKGILDSWSIVWVEKTNSYKCELCEETMQLSYKKMNHHYKSQHLVSPMKTPVLEVSKVYKKKTYYESEYNFQEEKSTFSIVSGPVCMKESIGNCVGILRLEVIPPLAIQRLYHMASVLEKHDKCTSRGKKINGSRMAMYGMFENHQCAWFKHQDSCMYALSELFANEIANHLRNVFEPTMRSLDRNLEKEGLIDNQGRFANTPFTCFGITRDYLCNPYYDPTDYGYGFIVWLHPDAELEIEDYSSFWLPQYNVRFSPPNGSAFLMNGNNTVHCTTREREVGVLGMAFIQKRPLIVQLKKALDNPNSILYKQYMNAKELYEKRRDENRGQGVAAQFYK